VGKITDSCIGDHAADHEGNGYVMNGRVAFNVIGHDPKTKNGMRPIDWRVNLRI
jgi:hypothetical protein